MPAGWHLTATHSNRALEQAYQNLRLVPRGGTRRPATAGRLLPSAGALGREATAAPGNPRRPATRGQPDCIIWLLARIIHGE
jgi:hypothetical protein